MAILWCGGEDVDFPDVSGGLGMLTLAGRFRAGYARCAVHPSANGAMPKTLAFPGGAVTSCWLSAQVYVTVTTHTNAARLGLVRSGSGGKGLWLGHGASMSKLGLLKYDGNTWTVLASETGTSLANGQLHRVDMQVIDYGGSASVDVYINGTKVIAYSGDASVAGISDLDQVALYTASLTQHWAVSELVVADEDTRLFSLVTHAPNGAGDANAWTGAYTDIDETTNSDADIVYSQTADQDCLVNLINLPAGSFTVKAVKVAARAAKGAAGISGLKLGVKTGGTVEVDAGRTLDTAWATYERLMAQNPVTSNNWLQSEMDDLQLVLRSAS